MMLKCLTCDREMDAADRFCRMCGKPVQMLRSENEIKAEMKRCEDTAVHARTMADIALCLCARKALGWAIGIDESPIEPITRARDYVKEKEKENDQDR